MKLSKALKQKNRLAAKIKDIYSQLRENNSRIKGAVLHFSVEEKYKELYALKDELIKLKTAIHRANAPVYEKIFRLAELKGLLLILKNIPSREGPVVERYSSGDPLMYESVLKTDKLENDANSVQDEIDRLQDELEEFNVVTDIDLD